jgi:chromosome segregation ATPase
MIRSRHDTNLDDLERENGNLRVKMDKVQNELKTITETNVSLEKVNHDLCSKYEGYNQHLEKENVRFAELLSQLRSENEALAKEKSAFMLSSEQLQLENKKLSIENESLLTSKTSLETQHSQLTDEYNKVFEKCKILCEENDEMKNRLKKQEEAPSTPKIVRKNSIVKKDLKTNKK